MTKKLSTASLKKALRRFYELDRPVTDEEAREEYENLKRRNHENMLFNNCARLIMSLPVEWRNAIDDDREYPA